MRRMLPLAVAVLLGTSLAIAGLPIAPARADAPDVWEPGAVNITPVGAAPTTGTPLLEPEVGQPAGELVSERTETSKTFLEPDGSHRTEVALTPLHHLEEGEWQDIDSTLEPAAEGLGFESAEGAVTTTLPEQLDSAPVEVAAPDAAAGTVAFALQGAAPATAAVDGAEATYEDALPGVDVVYQALADGVKESIVLAGPEAVTSYRFTVTASAGLTPAPDGAGGLTLVDGDGLARFAFAPPFMVDAAGTRSEAVTLSVVESSPELVLEVAADPGWLAETGRVWPVTVDPTLTVVADPATPDSVGDCYIASGSLADTKLCPEGLLKVGYDGASVNRLLFNFYLDQVFDEPVVVRSAELGLDVNGRVAGSGGLAVSVHEVTAAWSPNATWNRRTSTSTWAAAGGDYTAAAAASDTLDVPGTGSAEGAWQVGGIVQRQIDGTSPANGFLLRAVNEATVNTLKVYSKHAGTSTEWPRLTINWEPLLGRRDLWGYQSFTLSDRRQVDVNLASGNLVLSESDVKLSGTGIDTIVARSFNSRSDRTREAGVRWSLSTGPYLKVETNGDVTVVSDTEMVFRKAGTAYTSPSGANATLTRNPTSGEYTLQGHTSAERWVFTSSGRAIRQVDRNGNTISHYYNAGGHRTSISDTQGRVTTFTRNPAKEYLVDVVRDPAGREHRYSFSSGANRLLTYTDPTGGVTSYDYDASSRLTSITDRRGVISRMTYDSRGRVTSIIFASGTTEATTTSFDYSVPWKTTVTDPRGNTTVHEFDRQGRVTKVTDAVGDVQTSSYTSNSNVATYTSHTGGTPVNNTYSTEGNFNLVKSQLPTGAATSLFYDDTDNPFGPSKMTSPQGNATLYDYDAVGNLATVTDNQTGCGTAGCATRIDRNPNGTVSRSTDPLGRITTYSYDSLGNRIRTVHPKSAGGATLIGDETVEYDGLARPTATVDGNGKRTTYTYDAFDRLTKITYADATSVAYTYDANGNRSRRVDPTGTQATTYNLRNQITREELTGSRTYTSTYGYDLAGNLTSLTEPQGRVAYSYNAVNLLSSLTEPPISGDPKVYRSEFDYDHGNRTVTRYPNGVTQTATYDDSDRITLIEGAQGATVLTRFSYTYRNSAGQDTSRRQTMTELNGDVTTYTYGPLDRLAGAATKRGTTTVASYQYSYDANSNRTSQTANGTTTNASFNEVNQLTAASGVTYSYDRNGNQTANSSGQSMAYNAANNTTSSRRTSTSPTLDFAYAGAGQFERTTAGSGGSFTHTVLGVSTRTTGTTTDAYTRDANGSLVGLRDATSRSYYLFDGLGSIAMLTNPAGGMANSYTYDPYGTQLTAPTGTGSKSNPWRYAGEYYDTDTRQYKIGARYYQPNLGRWTQPDPIIDLSGSAEGNRYSYAGCNPTNNTDPTGLHGEGVGDAITSTLKGAGAGLITGAVTGCVLGALPTAWGGGFGCPLGALGGAIAGAAGGAVAGFLASTNLF